MTVPDLWVFGYGSLVSPESFGATIGRRLEVGDGFAAAELVGFGRRWNYGIRHTGGSGVGPDGVEQNWTLVALGLVRSHDEVANGVVVRVSSDELAALDRRERYYDRVDVTNAVRGLALAPAARVVTYLPSREATDHADAARRAGRAAIERRYWDLVEAAFADLGAGHLEQYRASTPDSGIPVVDVRRHAR